MTGSPAILPARGELGDEGLESAPCPFGCAPGDELVLRGRDLIYNLAGEFAVVRCRSCGLLRTNPRPSPDAMRRYYPEDYGPFVASRPANSGPPSPAWKQRLFRALDDRRTPMPSVRPGRLLEVGCAGGSFLTKMASVGWRVEGREMSPEAAETARSRGFRVHTGSLESAPAPEAPVELVAAWHVLEHLRDPVVALRRLHEWTTPGGWLVATLPNAGGFQFEFFRELWYPLSLPVHLFHFDPRSLGRLLRLTGWRLVWLSHQEDAVPLLVSACRWLTARGWAPGWLADWQHPGTFYRHMGRNTLLFSPLAWGLALLGQSGTMAVWARKDGDPKLPRGP
ncbi:MAG: class I SAM-dependent methyltransferase [Candidatus Riflebacteria bacterium]|nr:class I SAM-dependent methyltransferase [Candidatus Riflebacteria bacterium]